MSTIKQKIRSKYIFQNIFDFVPLNKTIKIVKYNKSVIKKLDYTKNIIKYFFLLKKIVKPIANCEDYLPIIRRILSLNTLNINIVNNNQILNYFCQYINKNNKFIPQISKISGNEEILNKLNYFKIGFNNRFINNFYDGEQIDFNKLSDFCNNYGKKIKEITFLDNSFPSFAYEAKAYYIMKYIIENSNIQRIEDGNHEFEESLFIKLFNLNYNNCTELNFEKFNNNKENNLINILKQLKAYSLYFNKQYNIVLKPVNDIVLLNSRNLEELEITNINIENSSHFVNLLKNFNHLKSLTIYSEIKDEKFFNDVADVIKENSLEKIKINLNYLNNGITIIKKNLKSLKELIIKINHNKGKKELINLLSNITSLKKLKIIAKFPIFNKKNFNLLNLQKVESLEIPLYITKYFFDLNLFFEKIPNLKKLTFYNINILNHKNIVEIKQKNIEYLEQYNLNEKFINNLKSIKFINSRNKSSFLIQKLLNVFSKNTTIKEKIKKIKIKNCEFDKEIMINDLMTSISSFKNLKCLNLNNISFENGQQLNYNSLEKLENLEKFVFKDINYEQNNNNKEIDRLYLFLLNLSWKNKNMNEIEISTKKLNGKDINIIINLLGHFKLLTKLSLFENYSKFDYFSNSTTSEKPEDLYINLIKIKYYCMIDLRNINIFSECNFYPKVSIKDYFFMEKKKKNYNKKKENYFIYQNLMDEDYKLKYLSYSKTIDSFEITPY